ncbi:MAG TPA: hypothetical protein VF508_11025 [Pyrinomonadaceae bacterium]
MVGEAEEKGNGRLKILVPTVPFTIEVAAPGYKTWTYSMGGGRWLIDYASNGFGAFDQAITLQ